MSTPPPPAPTGSNLESNGIYLFMDQVTNDTIKPVITWILNENLAPTKKKFLSLMICSPGGAMGASFALTDVMEASAIPIHTVGLGKIASCGLLIFMSGEKGKRILTPNTSILSHQWAWSAFGKEHELFAKQREYDLTAQRIRDHYKKHTKQSDAIIEKYLLPPQDIWLSAKEAKKYGLADSIKESPKLS